MEENKQVYIPNELNRKDQTHYERLCENPDAEIRLNACEALQMFPYTQTEGRFLRMLQDTDELVRCQACEALALGKTEQVLKQLITTALNSSGMLRGYAVLSIADVQKNMNGNSEKTSIFLVDLLNSEKDNWVRIAIYRSLIVLGKDVYFPVFLGHRKDADYHNRCFFLNLLEEMLDEGLCDQLKELQTVLLEMYVLEDTLAAKETIQNILKKLKDRGQGGGSKPLKK